MARPTSESYWAPLAAFTGNHRPCIDPDTDCLLRALLADLQSTRDHFDRLERHQVIDTLQDAAGQVVRILERTEDHGHG
ncbi:hypothetical protein [Marinobacter sp. NFXS9]|uniref:hypothetical protein n=1 Tax=Marinobacter sp. NFXS9 TaxID=2818433 RepID=UPI0032DE2D3F